VKTSSLLQSIEVLGAYAFHAGYARDVNPYNSARDRSQHLAFDFGWVRGRDGFYDADEVFVPAYAARVLDAVTVAA